MLFTLLFNKTMSRQIGIQEIQLLIITHKGVKYIMLCKLPGRGHSF